METLLIGISCLLVGGFLGQHLGTRLERKRLFEEIDRLFRRKLNDYKEED